MTANQGAMRATLGLDMTQFESRARAAVKVSRGMANGMAKEFNGASAAVGGINEAAIRAAKSLGALAAATVSFAKLNSATQAFTEMGNSLRVLGMEETAVTKKLAELGAMARSTRTPLDATVKLYQRATMAGRDLGASQEQIMKFTKNVGLAMAQQGGSAASASGALTQLSQAIGGTNIQAEEFNSLLDGAYPLVAAAAKGIDGASGSVGKLRAMVVDGQISSKEFFDAILSQSSALEAAFAATVPTVSQAMGVLNDQFTLFIGNADASVGISAGIAQAILLLADNIDRVAIYAATGAAAFGGAWVVGMVTATMATAGLSGALGFLRVAIAKTGIGLLLVGAAEAALWFLKLVKGAGGFGKALGLLGNVAGAVWQGIIDSAAAIPVALNGVWELMRGGFLISLSRMTTEFQNFIWNISNAMGSAGFDEAASSLMTVWKSADAAGGAMHKAGAAAQDAAAGAFTKAGGMISGAFGPARDAVGALSGAVDVASAAADAAVAPITNVGDAAAGAGGKAAKASEEAKKLISALEGWKEKLKTPVEKYAEEVDILNKLLKAGKLTATEYQKAVGMLNGELADGIPMVSDVADAFGDFITSGLRDFKGFAASILDSFKSMISGMIATAARNRIVIGMGLAGGGGVAGAAASAAAAPAAGGMGPLGGLLGPIGGFGASFMSGASGLITSLTGAGGGLGAAGTYLSATLGGIGSATTALGGLAAAAGAIALPLLAVGAVFSFFKTKTKLLDQGIKVAVEGLDTLVYSFKKVEKSKFWGLSKKTSTTWDAAEQALSDPITKIVRDLQMGVMDAASALGVGGKAFKDFTASIEFSTKDMSDEEIMAKLQEKILELGDSFAKLAFGNLSYLIKEGEGATAALSRLVSSMQSVNTIMDTLGHTFRATGLRTAGMAAELADLFGGLDAMQSATSTYYQSFYTEEERIKTATRQTSKALRDLGVTMPRTRDQYRQLIESLNLTSDAGRKAYAALVGMSGVFDQILPAVTGFTAKIAGMVESLTGNIDKMVADISSLQTDSLNAAKAWFATAKTLRDFVTKMRSVASALTSPQQAQRNAEAQYQILLARARAGDGDASSQITGAADTLLDAAKGTARSALDLARIEARILADMGGLASVADVEGQRHDAVAGLLGQQVDVLKTIRELVNSGLPLDPVQLKALTAQLGMLSAETVRAMGGSVSAPMLELRNAFKALPMGDLRTSMVELRQAVIKETARANAEKAKEAAVQAAQSQLSKVAEQQKAALARVQNAVGAVNTFDSNTGGNLVDKAGNAVKAYVNADGRAVLNATGVKGASGAHLDLWRQTFWKNGGLEDQMYAANKAVADADRALEAARKAVKAAGGVPAFAAGGMHSGGLRIVGERGPELEATGPSRIYSADKTRSMLGGGDREMLLELRALRREVADMKNRETQLLMRIASDTRSTKDTLLKFDVDGLPAERA